MPDFIERYRTIAIVVAVLLEELGVPMPIPTDILIVLAGASAGTQLPQLALLFALLTVASTVGASGLYAIVRRGGRPLVERFGRYVHLGPSQLDRAERLLQRGGWLGIAAGRAVPGLRYVTVIACGLLHVPYRRFVTAHIVGSSVYIAVFMALGAVFGPAVLDQLHVPSFALRALWLAGLAIGLPLLVVWCCSRAHLERYAEPSRRRVLGAVLLASFAGASALAAAWAGTALLTEVLGTPRPVDVLRTLAVWLLGRGMHTVSAYMLIYSTLLLLCFGVGGAYYELLLPRLRSTRLSLPRQVLGLGLLAHGLVLAFVAPLLLLRRAAPLHRLWEEGGPLLLLALACGIVVYAVTTVYGRALAIAVLPALRRPATQDEADLVEEIDA
ncbi:MAG TPA: DedA family protein [Roseiflexaceae bacterium]|nr:DedA family protein [Roseiflexaceae bacterium]